MKYIKILGLAVGAAAAFMAFVGAGTAAATVLCKTNTTPCSSMVLSGAELKAKLVPGTEMIFHQGFSEIKCKESTWSGKSSTTGSSTEPVSIPLGSMSFGICAGRIAVLKPGQLTIHWSKEMSGTVDSAGSEIEFEESGVTCVYGTPTATTIGTVTGGAPATLTESAEIAKISGGFLCASPAHWEGEYELTSPTPLYVAER